MMPVQAGELKNMRCPEKKIDTVMAFISMGGLSLLAADRQDDTA